MDESLDLLEDRADDVVVVLDNDHDEGNKIRKSKQIDRTDSLLGGFNVRDASELPLHEPTGEKTRKTYDFTSKNTLLIKFRRILLTCAKNPIVPLFLSDLCPI